MVRRDFCRSKANYTKSTRDIVAELRYEFPYLLHSAFTMTTTVDSMRIAVPRNRTGAIMPYYISNTDALQ
jgi:hypothetical protein